MDTVRIILQTPLEGFSNDLCEVLKLFYRVDAFAVNEVIPDAEIITHSYTEKDAMADCAFVFREKETCETEHIPQADEVEGDAEHLATVQKRVCKRLCKRLLYALLKELTGKRPPWGSLTGIRPTRLIYEGLAQGMTMQQARENVQRTFDVTDEKAELLTRIVTQQQRLPVSSVTETDVYISIPFCRTRCAYCSFPGEAIGKGKQIEPYVEALLWEMEESAQLIKQTGLTVRALYVGGGTPTALPYSAFERVMKRTMELFPAAIEYTVEAGRPDTTTREKLELLHSLGVQRISINPQTMNDHTLRVIGRDHTSEQTEIAYRMAREIGFEDINMDVIAGLPGETAEDFAHTMARILQLKPDSLTVHTLAIKRSSRLDLEKWPLPADDTAAQMVRMGEETARALGLTPYYLYRQKYMAGQQQNVGYAREGKACLYNVDIMEETTSIVAVGAGAISKRVFPDRELRIRRAPNVTNVAVYTERVKEMMERKNALFGNDLLEEENV